MIVADCSVVADVLLTEGADSLVEQLTDGRVSAPILIDYEFMSVVRGLVLGRQISEHLARDAMADFESLHIERWALPGELRRRVFELRDNFTAYDAAYVALAEALDCSLITRDRRLAKAAEDIIDVRVV